jgi:hypothetical protein
VLLEVLEFLGQEPASELRGAAKDDVLAWGVENWRLSAVPRRNKIQCRLKASY